MEIVDGKKISIEPNDETVEFQLNYKNKVIKSKNKINFNKDSIDISKSRTFILFDDIEKIKK